MIIPRAWVPKPVSLDYGAMQISAAIDLSKGDKLPWLRSLRVGQCDYCGNPAMCVPGRGEVCAACLDSIVNLESVMGMTSIMEDDHAENLSPNPVDGM